MRPITNMCGLVFLWVIHNSDRGGTLDSRWGFIELNWSEEANFQAELAKLRENLIVYAKVLAAIAGVEE